MKNILIILICTVLGIVSCTIDRCDYKVVIGYRIQNNTVTDTITIENVPEGCVPYFALGKDGLRLSVEGWHPSYNRTLYNGTKPVTVEQFYYIIMRHYKADKFTGKEICHDN